MIAYFPPKGVSFDEDDLELRADFASMSDEEVKSLRQKYKQWEKKIFAVSWCKPSVERYVCTCLNMGEAIDRARQDRDRMIVYCPWISEGLHTLLDDVTRPITDITSDESYEVWKKDTEETITKVCAAFGYLGKALSDYVIDVFSSDEEDFSCGWIDEVRHCLRPFFNIEDRSDMQAYFDAALEMLFDMESAIPQMKKDSIVKLVDSCITRGWPKVSRIEEDEPKIIYNMTNEELLELVGAEKSSPEEQDRIMREFTAGMMNDRLDGAESSAAEFFQDGGMTKGHNAEIALWRVTREMCSIARKARRDYDFYVGNSVEPPASFLSAILGGSRMDSFTRVFLACTVQVCEELPSLVSSGIVKETLFSASFAAGASVKAMMYYLDMLPHDEHLHAAARITEKWTSSLNDIVREENLAQACKEFIESAEKFGSELQQASDALSSQESMAKSRMKAAANHEEALIEKIMQRMKADPIMAHVVGFDANAKREIKLATHTKMPERDYFSGPNLCALFEVSVNTPANWFKGIGTPPGFLEAYEKKNYTAMSVVAAKYKANRGRADALNTKRVVRGISEEQIYKQGGNRACGGCCDPQ